MPLDPNDRHFFQLAPGFFKVEVMARVRAHFDATEAAYRERAQGGRDEWALRLGVGTDTMRFDPVWYDLWRELPQASVELLGPYAWLIFPPQVRHISQPSQLVPWHQDLGYQKLLGGRAHRQVVTCFVPLEPEPRTVASLEFAQGATGLYPHDARGDHGACIDDSRFESGPTTRFDLMCGDAILFGDHAPHRTVPGPDGTIDRRSFEFRLIEPHDAIDGKDYFDVARRCFVRTDGSERDHP